MRIFWSCSTTKGIDAGLAAGIFHQKLLGIRELKEYLNANSVEMRLSKNTKTPCIFILNTIKYTVSPSGEGEPSWN